MEFQKVASKNIAGYNYEPSAKLLHLKFASGGVYKYPGVSQELFDGFLKAESKGKFADQFLKGLGPTKV